MESRNRKFVVITATDVNKKEVTKVTEIVLDEVLAQISKVATSLKNDNKISSLQVQPEVLATFEMCLPTSYVKLHTVKEIKVLAVIGEIKLV